MIGPYSSCLKSLRVNRFNPIQLGSTRSSKSCRFSRCRCQSTNLISGDVQVPTGAHESLNFYYIDYDWISELHIWLANLGQICCQTAAFLTWPCWIKESLDRGRLGSQRNDAEKTWWILVIWTATTGDSGCCSFESGICDTTCMTCRSLQSHTNHPRQTRTPGDTWTTLNPSWQKKKWRCNRPMWNWREVWESASERRRKHHKTSTYFFWFVWTCLFWITSDNTPAVPWCMRKQW